MNTSKTVLVMIDLPDDAQDASANDKRRNAWTQFLHKGGDKTRHLLRTKRLVGGVLAFALETDLTSLSGLLEPLSESGLSYKILLVEGDLQWLKS